jgi:DNA-binding response OmpR family regulator
MQTSDSQPIAVVVDHDRWERWFTTEVLVDHGYTVLGASNGASGLRLVEQYPCAVILLDLALPELAGLEFLQEVKAADTTREVPVIVLGASPDDRPHAAEGCVPRPLEEVRVIAEIGRCLSRAVSTRPDAVPRGVG